MLTRWTQGTEQTQPTLVRNFSYKNDRPCGPRFACIGDAGCFLDPVFSSGVGIAMNSACLLTDALSPALAEGREADPLLLAPMMAQMDVAYETFGALIGRFYNSNFGVNFFLSSIGGTYRQGLISLLAGDVWRDDNPFQKSLLRSRRPSK
jgi:flavin-dependent dehydrogenase